MVVLGPSGPGKTTLLNLIEALDAPTAGTIRLNGRDLTTASWAQWTMIRRHTGALEVVLTRGSETR